MDPHLSMITLGVVDLERSRRFYAEGLGLPLNPSSSEDVAFFSLAGAWLALFPREELARDAGVPEAGSGFSAFSLAHNVSTKEEVDAVIALAVSKGGQLVKPGQDVFWGGYSGYFSDPDGFLWEVAWNPHMPELVTPQ